MPRNTLQLTPSLFYKKLNQLMNNQAKRSPLQLVNPRFHGNQRMIHLLLLSLVASLKTGLSEFRAVKFRYFLCKEEKNSKVYPYKVKTNSVHTFGQFLQFSFLPFIAVVHV